MKNARGWMFFGWRTFLAALTIVVSNSRNSASNRSVLDRRSSLHLKWSVLVLTPMMWKSRRLETCEKLSMGRFRKERWKFDVSKKKDKEITAHTEGSQKNFAQTNLSIITILLYDTQSIADTRKLSQDEQWQQHCVYSAAFFFVDSKSGLEEVKSKKCHEE